MQLEQRHYDVSIVGGGMAGGSLALELQQLGLSVVLLEKFQQNTPVTSSPEQVIALSWGTVQHLKKLNVWKDIEQLGVSVLRDVHVSQATRRASVELLHDEEGVDSLGFVVQNQFVVQALYKNLAGKVDIICPAEVVAMSDTGAGKRLLVQTSDTQFEIESSLVVGADGTYSQIRHMAGILSQGWDHNRFALVASVIPENPHRHVAYECFRADGPLAFLPLDSERFSIVWTLKPSDATRMQQASEMVFLSRLNMVMGEPLKEKIGRISASSKTRLFPLELRVSKQYSTPHLALVGNAARTLHPMAGQGMNISMRDVADLSACVQAGLNQNQQAGDARVLAAYAAGRKKDQRRTVALTEGLNLLFNHKNPALHCLNQGGLRLLSHLSFLRHQVSKQAAGLV
ncbi:MAG: FAD-dependent monooxygenase [Mariprofundaceae bacterium]|nr:FAD-dependent monooxygenase [Mariprofundaceae bacterium]